MRFHLCILEITSGKLKNAGTSHQLIHLTASELHLVSSLLFLCLFWLVFSERVVSLGPQRNSTNEGTDFSKAPNQIPTPPSNLFNDTRLVQHVFCPPFSLGRIQTSPTHQFNAQTQKQKIKDENPRMPKKKQKNVPPQLL